VALGSLFSDVNGIVLVPAATPTIWRNRCSSVEDKTRGRKVTLVLPYGRRSCDPQEAEVSGRLVVTFVAPIWS
jgi:hypothetical protein